jgi:hypothetical protein
MIYFIYFVFKWVRRIKVFKWCSKISCKWFIHLSCDIFFKKYCLQKFIQKKFLLSGFIQKGLQKFIKSPLDWIQTTTPIHFPDLYCHPSIFVPRLALEIRSYLSINLPRSLLFTKSTQVLLLTCQGHTFLWSIVDAPIAVPAINQSFLVRFYTIPFLLIP